MSQAVTQEATRRYRIIDDAKAQGATYTPDNLARFVAAQIVKSVVLEGRESLTILDPAIGDGALVLALLDALKSRTRAVLRVHGFDTDGLALERSATRIRTAYPQVQLELTHGNFLGFALESEAGFAEASLFSSGQNRTFDLIIANPPYVRAQIMGAERAQRLAETFGLVGRVDLYQAFLLSIAKVLDPDGAAGIIVSNRFMTTKGGSALRAALRQRLVLDQIWDLGDTKLFNAAVLPAVLVARGSASVPAGSPSFTSIYEVESTMQTDGVASDPVSALAHTGIVAVAGGRRFRVRHGVLNTPNDMGEVWRLASDSEEEWQAVVKRNTWKQFGEIGKIRVGVKTCADKVFIRHDWDSAFGSEMPELLRPLITHHGAGRFRATQPKKARAILYPHEVVQGCRQAIPLDRYPKSRAYLESHRTTLESRSYVLEAGRLWYELWVPQDPLAWGRPKLVFRDISERPTFWIDLDGSVVNGDCYWLATGREDDTDLLWLACAVANSAFAESFYDRRFNNKLYAGRRRFITQYVEQFPLPDPALPLSQEIIARAKAIYEADHASQAEGMERWIDGLVWQAFGLDSGD